MVCVLREEKLLKDTIAQGGRALLGAHVATAVRKFCRRSMVCC